MTQAITPSYFSKFLPSDPTSRAHFRVLCDHIRTTLDPDLTTLCLRGAAALTEERYDTEVAACFLQTAECLDDSRSHGRFFVGSMEWKWHFEREASDGGKPRRNEIGVPVLVIEC